MKKILFDVEVLDKHYCIYLDEETNKSYAYAIKKDEKAYVVKKQQEIDFLNKIVESLNKKYIKREIINYSDEYYYRYINKYNQKSYFSKMIDNDEVVCSYESIKELYDYYNSPKILMSKCSKITKITADNRDYSKYSNGYNIDNMSYNRKSKLPIKIAVSILGVAAFVTLGLGGYNVLSKTVLPNISESKEDIKDIDFKRADSEISEKYIDIQNQLSELGLENWEIAKELDLASITYGETDDISFYYDGDKDEIIYVDGIIELDLEVDKEEIDRDTIPENVQQILSALNSNQTLSYEEKSYIEEKFLPDWIQNSKYLQTEQLVDIYSRLKINYDYKPDGQEVDFEYIPIKNAAGMANIGAAELTIYSIDHFEPQNKTLDHEIKHFNGNFDMYESTLLNEGYTSLDISDTYSQEQLMVGLLIETFGTELINEAYYSSNLKGLVANNIVEKTGKTIEEATREVYDLFDDIESALYETAEIGENYRENDELMKEYQDIFDKLSVYYEDNNRKEMEKNVIASIIKDEIMGTNDTQMLGSRESVSSIKYSGDGTLKVNIVKNEGDLEYTQAEVGIIRIVDSKYGRSITIGPDEKYNNPKKIFSQIEDEDIDYVSR